MNLPGGKRRLVCKSDILTASSEPIVQKIWEPQYLTVLWAFTACYRDNFTFTYIRCKRSQDSVVGIVTGYGLDDKGVGVRVLVELNISSSPRHPEQLWNPLSLLSNGYQGLFPWGKVAGA
jgi:hypothetical protein